MTAAHVLAIDDDPSMLKMIADYLGDNDVRVTGLGNGQQIAEVLARDTVDLLVLDLRLPGEDGMQIARKLREESPGLPIIMLTGVKDEADRVMALELGADDYLTKPFSPRELLARIRALLRRSRAQTVADGPQDIRAYRFAGWELKVRLRRLVDPEGKGVPLTKSEFNLLAAFLAGPQRVLSRDQLLGLSRMHNDEVYDRSVDVQIGRLRKKIQPTDSSSELIRTERGVGYVFTAPVQTVR
jgi:DNA-binding response OmpR family regulator